jgi:competence protein ComEA
MKKYASSFFIILIGILIIFNQTVEVESKDVNYIKVEIKGYVKEPGVYQIEESSIVDDLIKKSGGLLINANTNLINLSRKLKDEDVVIIYSQEEVLNYNTNTIIKYIDKECVCPTVKNDGCLINNSNSYININTASIKELTTIKGIGEVRAKAIIKYREENGNFIEIEDIMKVKGIGPATFEKIKDYIMV